MANNGKLRDSDVIKGDLPPSPKKYFLECLMETFGNVTMAARIARKKYKGKTLNTWRVHHYHWIKADPQYAEKFVECHEMLLDFAEEKLVELMNSLNASSVFFFLKYKGASRGYYPEGNHYMASEAEPLQIIRPKEIEDNANGKTGPGYIPRAAKSA